MDWAQRNQMVMGSLKAQVALSPEFRNEGRRSGKEQIVHAPLRFPPLLPPTKSVFHTLVSSSDVELTRLSRWTVLWPL